MRYFLVSFFLLICHLVDAQEFTLRNDIQISDERGTMDFPLAGGLNAPQVSAADLNNDGLDDLHIFDRVGDVHLTFINLGIADSSSYQYAPEYASTFPEILNWVLLRDYDGDGIQDLFAFSDVQGISGLRVHKGFYQNDTLSFERIVFDRPFNLLYFELPTGSSVPLFISNIDYPAIDDIDCDGDLDILTFNITGGFVEFYVNLSVESGYERDSLIYELTESCWGGFFESGLSELIDLADAPGDCFSVPFQGDVVESRHTGSTLLSLDLNNDGARELILGDVSFDNLNLLNNGGSCAEAWMNGQDPFFPSQDISVNLRSFPAAFHLDLNNDGNKDFLAAPNTEIGGEDQQVMWFYENTGDDENPSFRFRNNALLVDRMIDLGTGAYPTFVDYNADGLMDLVLGNLTSFSTENEQFTGLTLLENRGALLQPEFAVVDRDYLGASRFNTVASGFIPRFRDLDGDGDLDLMMGLGVGELLYAENLAGPGQPISFGPWQMSFKGIDVGLASVPEVFDCDNDGRNDLVLGERNGNLNFFPNIGMAGIPDFSAEPEDSFWGEVDARVPGFFLGYSAPVIFEEETIGTVLITGTQNGYLEMYRIVDKDLPFESLTERLGSIRLGDQTNIDLTNLDEDPYLEMAIGNLRGGISIYDTPFIRKGTVVSASAPRPTESTSIKVFPNPSTDRVMVRIIGGRGGGNPVPYALYNISGQKIKQGEFQRETTELNLENLGAGIYWMRISDGSDFHYRKIVLD